jgi:hypothetical protein
MVMTRDVSPNPEPVVVADITGRIWVLIDQAVPLTLTPELAVGLPEVIRLADATFGVGAVAKHVEYAVRHGREFWCFMFAPAE